MRVTVQASPATHPYASIIKPSVTRPSRYGTASFPSEWHSHMEIARRLRGIGEQSRRSTLGSNMDAELAQGVIPATKLNDDVTIEG